MGRKIRVEHAGAAYRIMACSDQGQDIYANDRDRKLCRRAAGPYLQT
jgi:hypothetical protein